MTRSSSPTSSTLCEDDHTPNTVILTFSKFVGSYDFANGSVSPDYLRTVDIQVTVGPSSCDLVSATLSVTGEQKADQFKFVDSTSQICPD
jgi:hypothetical protein